MINIDVNIYYDALSLLKGDKGILSLKDQVVEQIFQQDYYFEQIYDELPEEYQDDLYENDHYKVIESCISVKEDMAEFDYEESRTYDDLKVLAFRVPAEFDEKKFIEAMEQIRKSEKDGIEEEKE